MVKIYTPANGNGFIWNIDANVGLRSPNNKDDVELVQFGYFALSIGPLANPALKPVAAKVVPGSPYTGALDDPLTIAILAHQKSRGGTQDGHISTIHGVRDVYMTAEGPHGFLLGALVNNMRDIMPNDFPRIDKHPKCPAALKIVIRKLLVG